MFDAHYDCSPDGDVGDGTVSSQDVLQGVQGAVHVNLRVRVLAENHKNVSFPFFCLAIGNVENPRVGTVFLSL